MPDTHPSKPQPPATERLGSPTPPPERSPTARDLSGSEYFNLRWISEHERITYSECRGKVLDALVSMGLVTVTRVDGQRIENATVDLTDAGRRALERG